MIRAIINGSVGQRMIHSVMLHVVRRLPTQAFIVFVHRIILYASSIASDE